MDMNLVILLDGGPYPRFGCAPTWAEGGTAKIKVNPTKVRQEMILPVAAVPSYLNFRHMSMTPTTVISDLDRFKLEKKRERNRIAASKCRQRKLERISDLGNHDGKDCSEIKQHIRGVLGFQRVKWRN